MLCEVRLRCAPKGGPTHGDRQRRTVRFSDSFETLNQRKGVNSMPFGQIGARSRRHGADGLGVAAFVALGLFVGPAATSAGAVTLNLYSAQHEQTVDLLTKAFTKETGIDVKVHSGEAPELASELLKERASSHGAVFFTENSPELELLSEKGLLAKVAPATLANVPAADSGSNGDWVGVLARENVLVFNKAITKEEQLPSSLLELAKPEWKGKLAIAPTDADFLPLVGAVAALKGRPAALGWLKGLREKAAIFADDEGGVAAVDVGGLMNVSGAAVLKGSRNQAAAQKFLAFLVSKPAQEMLSNLDITFEYPLVAGVVANPVLKPMSELSPPPLTLKQIGDDSDAAKLLREA